MKDNTLYLKLINTKSLYIQKDNQFELICADFEYDTKNFSSFKKMSENVTTLLPNQKKVELLIISNNKLSFRIVGPKMNTAKELKNALAQVKTIVPNLDEYNLKVNTITTKINTFFITLTPKIYEQNTKLLSSYLNKKVSIALLEEKALSISEKGPYIAIIKNDIYCLLKFMVNDKLLKSIYLNGSFATDFQLNLFALINDYESLKHPKELKIFVACDKEEEATLLGALLVGLNLQPIFIDYKTVMN